MSRPVRIMREPVLVTGGAGYIGSHLVDRIASLGGPVTLLDSLARPRAEANLAWLRKRHGDRIGVAISDVRDREALGRAMAGVATVFHLAAPPAAESYGSEEAAGLLDGAVAVLETAGAMPKAPGVILLRSHEIYGALEELRLVETDEGCVPADFELRRRGVGEAWPADLETPYGRVMGLVERRVLDGGGEGRLKTASLRMSAIYGCGGSGDPGQGWVNRFARAAVDGRPVEVAGDAQDVRDLLHVSDAVDACLGCARRMSEASGEAFNVGGGPANAVSLRTVLSVMAQATGRSAASRFVPPPPGRQRYYVADTHRARVTLGLAPPLNWRSGLSDLLKTIGRGANEAAPLMRATPAIRRAPEPTVAAGA